MDTQTSSSQQQSNSGATIGLLLALGGLLLVLGGFFGGMYFGTSQSTDTPMTTESQTETLATALDRCENSLSNFGQMTISSQVLDHEQFVRGTIVSINGGVIEYYPPGPSPELSAGEPLVLNTTTDSSFIRLEPKPESALRLELDEYLLSYGRIPEAITPRDLTVPIPYNEVSVGLSELSRGDFFILTN